LKIQQEDQLLQTDRASAFASEFFLGQSTGVVDHVKIIPSSSLITMQNLITVSHTVCAHIKVLSWDGGHGWPP